jgi:hypothetical protein
MHIYIYIYICSTARPSACVQVALHPRQCEGGGWAQVATTSNCGGQHGTCWRAQLPKATCNFSQEGTPPLGKGPDEAGTCRASSEPHIPPHVYKYIYIYVYICVWGLLVFQPVGPKAIAHLALWPGKESSCMQLDSLERIKLHAT